MVKITEKYLIRKFSKGPQTLTRKPRETDNEYLSRITHLYLQSQFVEEIAPFFNCKSVSVVYLQNNQLHTIHNMENFPNITHLYLQKNRISKIENLYCLKNLKKLYLGWNDISVLEGLEGLKNLLEVHIECQNLLDGETIFFEPRTMMNLGETLKVLNIAQNNVTSLNALSDLIVLEDLIANDNKLEDIDDVTDTLKNLPRLRKLKLTNNPIMKNRKYREVITLACRSLRVLDDIDIPSETRTFIENLAVFKESGSKSMSKVASDTHNFKKVPSIITGSRLFPLMKIQMMKMPKMVTSFSATLPPQYFCQSIKTFKYGSPKTQPRLNLK